MAIAALHTAAAFVEFWDIWQLIAQDYFFNTAADYPANAALWFLTAGIYMFTLGSMVSWHEKNIDLPLPKSLNYGMLISTAIIIIIMPQSGAWLFIPAVIALFIKEKQDRRALNW
jgi:hypothetical protein